MDLRTRLVQVAIFTEHLGSADAAKLYGQVFGSEPENGSTYLKPFGPNGILGSAFSQKGSTTYQVNVLATRADLIVIAQNPQNPVAEQPYMADAEEIIGNIKENLKLIEVSSASRLAFIREAFAQFSTLAECNGFFRSSLGGNFPEDEWSEFNLHMNKPTIVGDNTSINRLSRLATEMSADYSINSPIQPNIMIDFSKYTPVNVRYNAVKHVDVNTVIEQSTIQADKISDVLVALMDEAATAYDGEGLVAWL